MGKRTIYVREEDEALFDQLAKAGNLSAVIARAVKAEQTAPRSEATEYVLPEGTRRLRVQGPGLMLEGEGLSVYRHHSPVVEFTVEKEEKPEGVHQLMQVDPLCLEVGRGLLPLVDPQEGAPLLERVKALRRHLALELGIVLPGVRFRDNLQLDPQEYRICLHLVEVARTRLVPDRLLAVGAGGKLARLRGTRTNDPTYGTPASWIAPEQKEGAEKAGLRVLNHTDVVATQLTQVARSYAWELLRLEETEALLAPLRKTHPHLVALVMPGCFSLPQLWQVLRGLLKEQVSIRDLVAILEALLLLPEERRQVGPAIEAARQALRRSLCREYTNREGLVQGVALEVSPEAFEAEPDRWEAELLLQLSPLAERGLVPLVVASGELRPRVRARLAQRLPTVVVLSTEELRGEVTFRPLSTVGQGP